MFDISPKEEARFWAKVDRRGPNECWNWTACTNGGSDRKWYGRFCFRNKRYYAHRFVYLLSRMFPIEYLTDEQAILHICDNPLCCNPAHHALGTQADNVLDMCRKNRNRTGKRRRKSRAARSSSDYEWSQSHHQA